MTKCAFCGKEENAFRGIHVIGNDGNVNFFCSSKCRKNSLKLRRDKRKLKWTSAHAEERKKTIVKEARKVEESKAKKIKDESSGVKSSPGKEN